MPPPQCPSCHSRLEGDLIFDSAKKFHPDNIAEQYKYLSCYCPFGSTRADLENYAKTKRWGRGLGIELDGYDGISLWYCSDCGHVWKRFAWVKDSEVDYWRDYYANLERNTSMQNIAH